MNSLLLLVGLTVAAGCATSTQDLGGFAGDAGGGDASLSDARSHDGSSLVSPDAPDAPPRTNCGEGPGTSAEGCEFYTFNPDPGYDPAEGANCFAAFLSNGGDSPVTLSLDYGGVPITNYAGFVRIPSGSGLTLALSPAGGDGNVIPPGQVAIVFLAGIVNDDVFAQTCPAGVNAAVGTDDVVLSGTGFGKAFHITTDGPVTAYDIFPYGGGSAAVTAATLLLPTSTWSTGYIAVDPIDGIQGGINGGGPFVGIVGSEDGTQVTIRPTADITATATIPGSLAGTPQTYTVNRGQLLQFEQSAELAGSTIKSDKPIGVFGGAACTFFPDSTVRACDTMHQQIPPVSALGSEYVVARYRDRYAGVPETPPVRIFGAVDGTTLTYDPAPPDGAPATLDGGQVVQFDAGDAFTVRSQDAQHPFYVAATMTGCQDVATRACAAGVDSGAMCEAQTDAAGGESFPGEFDCRGDPEFVNVVPSAQYVGRYVFFTDPTYPETEVVVVRQKVGGGFADVQLDCLNGNVAGWTDVGTDGNYQVARVDLVSGNYEKQGDCDNGQHVMSSAQPFGITVWGWGSAATGAVYKPNSTIPVFPYSQAVSYAYPGGTSVAPINNVALQ